MLQVLGRVAGRKFLGAIYGADCIELVFDDPTGLGDNLITIDDDGSVRLGFISQELIKAGYLSEAGALP